MRKLKNAELERKSLKEFRQSSKTPIVVVLDNVRSLNNIGSIFRTGDCFLIEKIILCGISATPPHKDIHKTALGATESVEWEYYELCTEALDNLKSAGYIAVAVEQTDSSTALHDFTPSPGKGYALVFGHEVKGISQEVIDRCEMAIEIPQYGTKHSFNVAVSAGIVMWDLFRKMQL